MYRDVREPCKIIVGVRMRLALKWCQNGLELFFSLTYATVCLYYRHVLFVFSVNRHDSRMHSTLGLLMIRTCAIRFAVSLQG